MTGVKRMLMVGIVLSSFFVVVGALCLSNSVETLDEVAEHFGATDFPIWNPPISDYEIHGFEGNVMVNIAVGIVFTVIVLVSTFAVGKSLRLLKSRA
jgi:hypothetical protein